MADLAEQVLDHFRDRFVNVIDANAIVLELEHCGIISNGDQTDIRQKTNPTQQNQLLHACLKKKCTVKALMIVCDIITKVKGNPKLKSLGEDMKTELEKGPGSAQERGQTAGSVAQAGPGKGPVNGDGAQEREQTAGSVAEAGPGKGPVNGDGAQEREQTAGSVAEADKNFGRCLVTCVCLAVLIPLVGVAVCLCPLPFTNDWQHWMCPSGIPWPWSWGQSDTCTEAAESHKVQPTVSEQKDDITALLKHAHERQAVAQSPVVEAARHNQLPTVRILLDGETATVDDQDEDGRTALMWASRNGHQEIVSLLVDDYNANVFQRDEDGFNALHVAAQGGHWEVIKLLHRKFGARVHDGDNNNDTMLHWAAFSGHCGVARYLIEEFGMDPQDRDKWGATALLSAAFGGSALVGKMLLEEFGSSIDEEAYDNCHGWNALHFAAGACHLEMVKYLLPLFGEKKFKQDNDGRTCLDLAINAKCREVVAYLLQEGGFANHLN